MRVVFMGTPDFSTPALQALKEAGYEIAAVYSRPPAEAGRGQKERLSPVHAMALEMGIGVETPPSLRSEEVQARLRSFKPDVIVVIAYGLLLPKAVLDIPPLGCLNIHASLLPRWRGAAPIQRAIMAGDMETGVAIMRMEEGLDTGPFCRMAKTPIAAQTTAADLHHSLAQMGANELILALRDVQNGTVQWHEQPSEGITYAKKIDKAEARIDWGQEAQTLAQHINGLSPFPGAWCELHEGARSERIKILRAIPHAQYLAQGKIRNENHRLLVGCGQGTLEILEIQRAGKKPNTGEEARHGFQNLDSIELQ